jgi:hypothetical protein
MTAPRANRNGRLSACRVADQKGEKGGFSATTGAASAAVKRWHAVTKSVFSDFGPISLIYLSFFKRTIMNIREQRVKIGA